SRDATHHRTFIFHSSSHLPDLHSFPTRRSSDLPLLAILVWFLIFFVYVAIKGMKRIALTAGVLSIIAMVSGHTVTLLDTRMKDRSEEHTSELQSRENLVCRLLLEKKKKQQ